MLKGVLSLIKKYAEKSVKVEMNEADFGALFVKYCCAVFSFSPRASNFADFIHCASRICSGQNVKALVWR